MGIKERLALMEVGVGGIEECVGIEACGGFHREAAEGSVYRVKVTWRQAFGRDPVLLDFASRGFVDIFPFAFEQFGFFLGGEDA